jgi:hypothetical protein
MSKQNKANKSNYIQAGRLSPDDLAREQQKQRQAVAPDTEIGKDRPPRQEEKSDEPPKRA